MATTFRYNERIYVRLHVRMPTDIMLDSPVRPGQYFPAVTGPGLQLGFWDHNRAPRMSYNGQESWIKDLWILKNTALVYKYVLVNSITNETLAIEKIRPRRINIRAEPFTVHDVFFNARRSFSYGDGIRTHSKPYWRVPDPRNMIHAESVGEKVSDDNSPSRHKHDQQMVSYSQYQKNGPNSNSKHQTKTRPPIPDMPPSPPSPIKAQVPCASSLAAAPSQTSKSPAPNESTLENDPSISSLITIIQHKEKNSAYERRPKYIWLGEDRELDPLKTTWVERRIREEVGDEKVRLTYCCPYTGEIYCQYVEEMKIKNAVPERPKCSSKYEKKKKQEESLEEKAEKKKNVDELQVEDGYDKKLKMGITSVSESMFEEMKFEEKVAKLREMSSALVGEVMYENEVTKMRNMMEGVLGCNKKDEEGTKLMSEGMLVQTFGKGNESQDADSKKDKFKNHLKTAAKVGLFAAAVFGVISFF